jgi:hypothetical protein
MNFFNELKNYFGRKISLESYGDNFIAPPCPLQLQITKTCVCMTCDLVNNCPMEILCRQQGCEMVFIRGCTSYTNRKEKNCEEKREVFREGSHFDGGVFCFRGKPKTNSTI